jgi:glucan phosphorylase
MKAAMNGVLNLSILDGWWPEACQQGVNGWQIGDGFESSDTSEQDAHDLKSLYDVLLNEVIPTYYDVALTTKYARDDESADMLDIIKQGKIYDLGYYCNAVGELGSTGYNLSKMPSPDFASFYAKNEKAAIKALEKLVKAYLD